MSSVAKSMEVIIQMFIIIIENLIYIQNGTRLRLYQGTEELVFYNIFYFIVTIGMTVEMIVKEF